MVPLMGLRGKWTRPISLSNIALQKNLLRTLFFDILFMKKPKPLGLKANRSLKKSGNSPFFFFGGKYERAL